MTETTDSHLAPTDSEITYELDVARDVSTDFLVDARGAICQAEIESLVGDFQNDGYAIDTSYRFGAGTVSLVLAANDPETLHAVSAAADELGYELPEPHERLGHTPEELYDLRTFKSGSGIDNEDHLVVEHALHVRTCRQLSGAIEDLMRGHQISPASRRNLQTFANSLVREAYKREEDKKRSRETPPGVAYEKWAITAASELAYQCGLDLGKAEEILLAKLAPYDDPNNVESYLIGYPETLATASYEGPEPATRDLLWTLYNAAWDKTGLSAPEIFCGADPDTEPFIIGLHGPRKRKLVFTDHPDLYQLSCATREDLHELHHRLTKTIYCGQS